MATAAAVNATRVPVVTAPGTELAGDDNGDGPLRSIADSGVLLLSLRQSRDAILSSVFSKFAVDGKLVVKPGEPAPPSHATRTLGECELEIGPHTFLSVFYEISYPAPSPPRPPLPRLPPSTPAQPTFAETLRALDPSLELTQERIQQVAFAASNNLTLSHLLGLATEHKATKAQEQMLVLLVKSLPKPLGAASSSSIPAKRGPGRPPKPKPGNEIPNLDASTSAALPSGGHAQTPKSRPDVPSSTPVSSVKRGPGRPPKSKPPPDNGNEAIVPVVPKKRGPGRPRKVKARSEDESEDEDQSRGEDKNEESRSNERPPPKKRGPGRPRKSSPPPSESEYEEDNPSTPPPPVRRGPGRLRKQRPIIDLDDSESDAKTPPARRGPGRPRKVNAQPDKVEPLASSSLSVRPKRRPGRPPKVKSEDEAEVTTDEEEPPRKKPRGRPPKARPKAEEPEESLPPKRRRGRPPKAQPVDASSDEDIMSHETSSRNRLQGSKSMSAPENASASDGSQPRTRRSRRLSARDLKSGEAGPHSSRRTQPATRGHDSLPKSKPANDSSDSASSEVEEVAPKRRRGRPPKPRPPTSSQEEIDEQAEIPVKRRPGRPRKIRPVSLDQKAVPSATRDVSSDAESVTNVAYSAPVGKRGPGRPPKPRPIARPPDPPPKAPSPNADPTKDNAGAVVPSLIVMSKSVEPQSPNIVPRSKVTDTANTSHAGPSLSVSNAEMDTGPPAPRLPPVALKDPDIVFEFKECAGVMWMLPMEPVLYRVTPDSIELTTTIHADAKGQDLKPRHPHAAQALGPSISQSTPPLQTQPRVQLLRIRLKRIPAALQIILEQRANDNEQAERARNGFKVQKSQSVPRKYPAFQLHQGPLLEHVQSAAFPQPATKLIMPPPPAAPPKRRRRMTATGEEPARRRRRPTPAQKCPGCGKVNVPLQNDTGFCSECIEAEKRVEGNVTA